MEPTNPSRRQHYRVVAVKIGMLPLVTVLSDGGNSCPKRKTAGKRRHQAVIMCVSANARSPHLASPQRGFEDGDVEFLVGEYSPQTFIGKRNVLAAASPVFDAMFNGPLAEERTIQLPDVDPRAFQLLLRHCNEEDVDVRSCTTALNALYVADKYFLPALTQRCCQYLYDRLQPDIALHVFANVRQYSHVGRRSPSPNSGRVPSAPTEEETKTAEPPPGVTGWSAVLLSRCLDYIDLNAELVLVQEELEDLELEPLRELLSRDTLYCHELTVLRALNRWAEQHCRREHISPTPANRRACLGELLYLVRFPLLTPDEFMAGPIQTDLLTLEDTRFFSALCTGTRTSSVPAHLQRHLQRMLTARTSSVPHHVTPPQPQVTKKKTKVGCFNTKSKTDKQDKPVKNKKKSAKTCFANTLIDVLVCIFD